MMPEDSADYIAPDILIVPLLAFDQTGNRMGYGQGHYDETIRLLRQEKEVLSVGLAYAEQAVLLALPTEPHDQKLDLVITPQRVFDFRP
jgi:5-formyltetrahydrofolate cyclo-ligase